MSNRSVVFRHISRTITTALLVVFGLLRSASAVEWQWSVPLNDLISAETNDHPRAFLWIPPNCQRVRAVVVAQHNMEEEPILEHPKFRETMSQLGIAEIWVTPGFDLFFRFDKGIGESFTAMMKGLAQESGYKELEYAPIVPLGHSAAASYPWNFAAWNPERTLAVISVSGQWPYYKDSNTPDWGQRVVDGIPGLVSMGEYEDAENRAGTGLQQLKDHPNLPLTMLANPAAGHFEVSDEKVAFLAFYIRKALQYRYPTEVPSDRPPTLRPIHPTTEGWLIDRWHADMPPKAPAAEVNRYTGDKKNAFWCFDEETARVIESFGSQYRRKKADLLGYVQAGGIVPQNPKLHAQVELKFEPQADGMTFKLGSTFLDTVPEGRPESWTGLKAGASVSHATGGGPIVISRICGPVKQLGADTFSLRFYRMGMRNSKRSNEIWLAATHPGDEQYKRAVQQANLRFPLNNTVGANQTITFPVVPNQPLGVKSLNLAATSSAKVPVYYYVREGPAEVDDEGALTFTNIPPRAKFPIKVTVVAWQWGRSIEPKLKTAEPVERTFLITK